MDVYGGLRSVNPPYSIFLFMADKAFFGFIANGNRNFIICFLLHHPMVSDEREAP